jgi:oligoendopeptidase F
MVKSVPRRSEIPTEHTWDIQSLFSSDVAWEAELERVQTALPELAKFKGKLSQSPGTLADWFEASADAGTRMGRVYLYANLLHDADMGDPRAKARLDRATGLLAQASAATAFAEPELIAMGFDTLTGWAAEEPRLEIYRHYFDRLERRQEHVRSAEVEEVLGLVQDPFGTATATHNILADSDLSLGRAITAGGETIDVVQGNVNALLSDSDSEVRRTAWETYSDAHVAMRNTMANCLAAGVKQHVFSMRVRRYESALEAAVRPNEVPVKVFHNLIATYRKNLPIWHKYWAVRRRALGLEGKLQVYDIKAPLTQGPADVPYRQAVEWIVEGMAPLGDEYVHVLRRGATEERWVDMYPNQQKTSGAYSAGWKGTHPFILMSYNDDIYGMSTLAHELGHSMHSYYTWKTQPFVYGRYGIFLAEVASNFNQALVRAHLMQTQTDPDFQIAVIEEAMSNFHRYFFIMPALARFELEIHERVERGQGLPAEALIELMADLFAEGYGDEVEVDRDRVGITWAEFSHHLYMNFYVYQYATGISAAHALAQGVLEGGEGAADRYITFLKSGGSRFPMETLRLAGVDMTSPEPVEQTFGVLADMVDRLEELVGQRAGAGV